MFLLFFIGQLDKRNFADCTDDGMDERGGAGNNYPGCQWSLLPNDFPPYKTVFSFYNGSVKAGLWEVILGDLVVLSRKADGREEVPSYSLIDSQSAKTTGPAEERGIDGGKNKRQQ